MMPKSDPIDIAIRTALAVVAAKDAAMHAAVLEDIRRNGTWWAASEIKRLREDLQRARRALRERPL